MKWITRMALTGAVGLAVVGGVALAQKNDNKLPKPDSKQSQNDNSKMTEEWGYKRPGKEIRTFVTGDLDECKDQCLRNQSCRAYVFRTGSGECSLKFEATGKEKDKNRVSGLKVPRGGKDDKDDFGAWAEAKKGCRDRVEKELRFDQNRIKVDFDEDSGNSARFIWHAGDNRGTCTATQNGRVTDFNTRGGSVQKDKKDADTTADKAKAKVDGATDADATAKLKNPNKKAD